MLYAYICTCNDAHNWGRVKQRSIRHRTNGNNASPLGPVRLALSVQRFNRFRVQCDDLEQRSGRPGRLGALLLPVLQGAQVPAD